jgi:hypothetical protein
MTHYGTWISYSGTGRLALAVVLLAAAGGLAYAASRLRRPLKLPTPSRAVSVLLVAAWALALGTLAVGLSVYIHRLIHDHLAKAPPADPITAVTISAASAVFAIVLIVGPTARPGVRLASATIAAMAAPMIFELPFDLIVMARTYPAIAPDPALYRACFFAPLFLVELTTLALLSLSPMVRVSRASCYFFALTLIVFAIWGLSGFGYPSAPLPIAFNVVSKLVAFAAGLSLFVPDWFTRGHADRQLGDGVDAAPQEALGPATADSQGSSTTRILRDD